MGFSFDRLTDIYDRTRGLPEEIMEKLVKVLFHELKGYKRILDAGVGTGRFAMPLQALGFDIVGIDISAKMLKKAAKRGVKDLLLSDICCLPFKDSYFEVTISAHLLHLIRNWRIALREITRVTRNRLISPIYTTPNPVTEKYLEFLKGDGYAVPQLGISEAELKNIIQPTRSRFAVDIAVKADKTLSMLKFRGGSFQSEIPDELHCRAMKQLKGQFSGKTYYRTIEIVLWDISKLKAFLGQTLKLQK